MQRATKDAFFKDALDDAALETVAGGSGEAIYYEKVQPEYGASPYYQTYFRDEGGHLRGGAEIPLSDWAGFQKSRTNRGDTFVEGLPPA